MKIKEIRLKEDGLAEIDSLIQTYTSGGFSTGGDTIYLQLENNGNEWKIPDFTNPYWNHEWNRQESEVWGQLTKPLVPTHRVRFLALDLVFIGVAFGRHNDADSESTSWCVDIENLHTGK